MKKPKTYFDKLMENDEIRKAFEEEYPKVVISEKIAKLRKEAKLTQEALARKIHTTKSAISRYESADYSGYTISLLQKIARACNAEVDIKFVHRQ